MKHAFLIMAHNQPELLSVLLSLLKHPNNSIYVHVDKKVKGTKRSEFEHIVLESGAQIIVPAIDVRWGDISQIECEMALFAEAQKEKHDYYHLLSGVDMPLHSMDYFHDFFEKHRGDEFINVSFDEYNMSLAYERTNYYYIFMKHRNSRIVYRMRNLVLQIQRHFHYSRCLTDDFKMYKGHQWCSLSGEAVKYLLSRKKAIIKRFRYTLCPDEIYKQTMLMNSPFKEKIYKPNSIRQDASLRLIDWERGCPYVWRKEDAAELMSSENLFARKFSNMNMDVIDCIRGHICYLPFPS